MKYLFIVLFLIPLISFAGGSHENNYSHSSHTGQPSSPPLPPPPQVIPSHPTVIPPVVPPALDNGQIYCSSPTAPGYQVGVPNGGCSPTTVIRLKDTPNTGLSLWKWFLQLFQ